MNNQTKVFLPQWVGWVVLPVLLLIWGFLTYLAFAVPASEAEIGLIEWLVLTVVLAVVAGVVWLQSSGRLPAFIIKREGDD